MKRVAILAALAGLALCAYKAVADWAFRVTGNPEPDPFTEPWGDC